jgi:hypothetical protein
VNQNYRGELKESRNKNTHQHTKKERKEGGDPERASETKPDEKRASPV